MLQCKLSWHCAICQGPCLSYRLPAEYCVNKRWSLPQISKFYARSRNLMEVVPNEGNEPENWACLELYSRIRFVSQIRFKPSQHIFFLLIRIANLYMQKKKNKKQIVWWYICQTIVYTVNRFEEILCNRQLSNFCVKHCVPKILYIYIYIYTYAPCCLLRRSP